MLYGCKSLSSIDLSKIAEEEVTRIEYMFYQCNRLNYIDISPFDYDHLKFVSLFYNLQIMI